MSKVSFGQAYEERILPHLLHDDSEELWLTGRTSKPRQVPHKELTSVEEEEKEVSQEEDGAGASGSDLSVDSELDYFIQ